VSQRSAPTPGDSQAQVPQSGDPVEVVLPIQLRAHLDGHLPPWLQAHWFASKAEALALAPLAQIGWFDMYNKGDVAAAIRAAGAMRWLNTAFAGLDGFPLAELRSRGIVVTNGAGINAITIAEYVVMGLLSMAKAFPEVLRAQQRGEWLKDAPGKRELAGSEALILGAGSIGALVRDRLRAFDMRVTMARRRPDAAAGEIGRDDWRARLGCFDWIVLAVPSTPDTRRMLGAAEFAAMKPCAGLVNVARGNVIDQDALIAALRSGHLGGAFLDVCEPEPLPAGHPLWTTPGVTLSMHLSGRSQTHMFERSAVRFLDNLARWRAQQPLLHRVDLALGY